MNKLKRINIVFIIIILIVGMLTNKTYAVLNCNVNLSTTKDKVTYNEQFSVYVTMSNLQTTKGIIAIGATLSYDTNSLTLVEIKGENNWSNPRYSSSSGKLTSLNNKLTTSNGTVFKITFEVNEKGKATNDTWIKISNFEISDGDEENNCGGSSINITIEEPNSGNVGDDTQGGNQEENKDQNSGDNTTQGENNQGGNSENNIQNGNNQTNRPNTGTITKPPVNTSTNEQGNNIDNEENTDNNIDTNIIENDVGEDSTDNKNENIQNTLKENTKSKGNKTLIYIIGIATIIVIIGVLFLIMKYWK